MYNDKIEKGEDLIIWKAEDYMDLLKRLEHSIYNNIQIIYGEEITLLELLKGKRPDRK